MDLSLLTRTSRCDGDATAATGTGMTRPGECAIPAGLPAGSANREPVGWDADRGAEYGASS